MGARRFLARVDETSVRIGPFEGVQIIPVVDIHFAPVVEPRTLQLTVVGGKTELSHKVEHGACGTAEAGDISGVGRDFRLDQDYVKWYVLRHVIPLGQFLVYAGQWLPVLHFAVDGSIISASLRPRKVLSARQDYHGHPHHISLKREQQ
jgi:hypothetical protein